MAYCTNAELKTAMGGAAVVAKYTDDSGAVPTEATITDAIARGDGEIDSYLSVKYKTPINIAAFPKAAPALRGMSIIFATRLIQLLRDGVSPKIEEAYHHLIEWLQANPQLPADSPLTASTSIPSASFGSQTRVTGRANMERL